jgi:hypothetical protein
MAVIKKTVQTTKNDASAQYTSCMSAITSNFAASQTWTFDNKPYKRADILNLLQAAVQAMQTTKADHDTWLASVKAEKTQRAALQPVLAALHKTLEAELGEDNPALAQYGFTPAQPRVQTAASKAAAIAKGQATRAAKKAALAASTAGAAPAPAANAAPAATPPVAPAAPKTA